jgi:acyl transferase domain-containing protein/NAD(P)-dependent dehydrogenase (short-subunit alcohol dehydrogenase family)/SAM-dependent methyltransferase/acyl carrier protein
MSELSAQDRRSLLRDAVRAVDEMRGKLEALERARNEPIAIIGVGCRYPGAETPDAYWHLLENGGDAVTEVPASRWTADAYADIDAAAAAAMPAQRGGFLPHVDQFDPQFFGISPREAVSMDPQQRLVLEVSWEALEHACVSADSLRDSLTGVFLGITSSDYSHFLAGAGSAALDVYAATGNSHNAAAGRLAYTLGLHGPALAIDSACSSSLVSIHLACQSLRTGDSDLALAGGVNCMLLPGVFLLFHKAAMTAPDGRCKVFDEAADGFVRAEGCGMVVLKRLSDAIASNDRVLAVVRGSAVNQDGASSGLTVPNGPAQEAVIRRALAVSGVAPAHVSFVEAHGTGTSLGDPIELEALDAVLGEGRTPGQTLLVGSAKANLGHTEAASGVAGLIKTVMALQHAEIPPQIHFNTLNPRITLRKTRVVVPTALTPWPAPPEGRRIAGVSSFGLSGTNAHVIVEEAPPLAARPAPDRDRTVHVLTLSAKTREALSDLTVRWQDYFRLNPEASAADVAYSAGIGRSHFAHRLAIIGDSVAAFDRGLASCSRGEKNNAVLSGRVVGHARKSVVFLFSGQGSQYPGMSRELYDVQPTFRRVIDQCAEVLKGELDVPLVDLLYRTGADAARLDETLYAQPALFAVEYALAELWRSWGVTPDAVMGHSVGEYVAACVAGVFSLEDALRLVAARGRLMQALPATGAMAAVLASLETTEAAAARCGSRVEIAAVNAPSQTVVSGTRDDVAALIAALETEGVEARRLRTSHAFHSRLLEPMLDEFEAAARKVRFGEPAVDLISNVTGLRAGAEVTQPRYWRDHARNTVQCLRGLETLRELGHRLFLEVGPGSTLAGLARQAMAGDAAVCATSLRHGAPECQTAAEAVATLYTQGVTIDWAGFDRDYPRRKMALPTYPFQRKRFWLDVQKPSQARRSEAANEPWREWLHQYEWAPLETASAAEHARPAPPAITTALRSDFDSLCRGNDLAPYQFVQAQLSRVSASYVARAFATLGWDMASSDAASLALLMDRAHVAPRFGRLVARMFGILQEDANVPLDPDPDATLDGLLGRYPEFGGEVGLMQACGPRLADVLTGVCDPIEILFPQGSLDRLERVYQESPGGRVFNGLVGRAVAAALPASNAGRKVRILEIGAGTGSATTSILELLDPRATEYVFTDVSSVFTTRAKKKFAAYPFVEYHLLDVSQPPSEQGFAQGQFDVIVAANVLHATPNLRQTLAHVAQLLAPQGALILFEGTARQRAIDLTFGLTDGWWSFADTDLRPAHALLSAAQWVDLLAAQGFSSPSTFPDSRENPEAAVIVARISQALPASTVPVAEDDGWLVFADERGYGDALASHIRGSGGHVLTVRRSASFEAGATECRIDPARPEDYDSAMQWAVGRHAVGRVVDLWPIDATLVDGASPADVESSQLLACGSTLWLVQALAALDHAKAPSLALVTCGARAVGDVSKVEAAQASVWGMGRVTTVEYPGLRCVRADLDPGQLPEAATLVLRDRLSARGLSEDQLAFRGSECFAPRLVASAASRARHSALSFKPDATYVITGAFRGIGLLTARWMVDRGARRLVLIGRRPPEAEARAVFESLEARGAALTLTQCDVGDREALMRVLDGIDLRFPLRGVIHSAGALDDAVLAHQTWDRFRNVMTAKVHGAWNLHELTRTQTLDFFVLFSSAAALLASAGQANHAAVNAFMDGLAHRRRSMGLPALTINWGAWRDVGAAERSGTVERLRARGVGSIAPEDGIAILEHLMGGNDTQVVALPLTLVTAEDRTPRDSQPAAAGVRDTAMPAVDWRRRVDDAGEDRRTATVLACVVAQVEDVLRVTSGVDPQQPLSDLGLDSLMAVELKNRLELALGVTIPLARILAGQNSEGLGVECLNRLDTAPRPGATAAGPVEVGTPGTGLDQLSEDAVDALLGEMLAQGERNE